MSPSVITSVAFAPRLRIDETGLPTSTSRVSTVARIGGADRGVRQFLVGALDGGARLRHVRRGLRLPRLRDDHLTTGRATTVLGLLERRARLVEPGLGNQLLIEELLRAVEIPLRQGHLG